MYKNRQDAGKQLGDEIKKRGYSSPIIFALTKGGVPVGWEVSQTLKAPLKPVVVQKLSTMDFPELGFGAIAPDGVLVIDNTTVDELGLDHLEIQNVKNRAKQELLRKVKQYEINTDIGNLSNNTAILVDDGIATGLSARAAAIYLRKFNPSKLVLASPVCPSQIVKVLLRDFDETICLEEAIFLLGVSQFYESFAQVNDKEVKYILNKAKSMYNDA